MHAAVLYLALQGFVLTLTTNVHPVASAGIAELLNLNDIDDVPIAAEQAIVTNSLKEVLEDNNVGTLCHVEYKVTKREAGRCIKLGRGIRACASDTYLDPFHPECM